MILKALAIIALFVVIVFVVASCAIAAEDVFGGDNDPGGPL